MRYGSKVGKNKDMGIMYNKGRQVILYLSSSKNKTKYKFLDSHD